METNQTRPLCDYAVELLRKGYSAQTTWCRLIERGVDEPTASQLLVEAKAILIQSGVESVSKRNGKDLMENARQTRLADAFLFAIALCWALSLFIFAVLVTGVIAFTISQLL